LKAKGGVLASPLKLQAGCKLALLFWDPAPWTAAKTARWVLLLTTIYAPKALPANRASGETITEAYTKVLCDALRHAVSEAGP